ncbi:unnamed protein product [Somion occarium]|uniref:WD40 repeat-like protein n=1 Tax=Somion occarium TaxID=3059160 RepID=A0ABP1E0T7_9APHY
MTSYYPYTSLGVNTTLTLDDTLNARKCYMRDVVNGGFPYSRKLAVHTSCVNAVVFANAEGRWLASAGDDPFVYLWDFYQDDLTKPVCGYVGHRANVFSLAFSATNHFLFVGDTDSTICKHDVSRWSSCSATPGRPIATIERHRESVRALSCHPENDDLLLSAGDDGQILLHDFRAGNQSRAQGHLFGGPGFTGVQYHPIMPNLFLTGDSLGEVILRDIRMSFDSYTLDRQGVIQEYVTALSKRPLEHLSRAEVGSLTFDRTVTLLHYLPTIYALMDPHPLAVCSGRNSPDGTPIPEGERTYSNSCTIKHGSFGGPGLDGDEYYSAGSDDFRAYVWRIPDTTTLLEARERVGVKEWDADEGPSKAGFTSNTSKARYIPLELSTPLCRLGGHRSIVNSALMHPHWPLLVTAGVERHMTLHSPFPSAPCASNMALTPHEVRALPPSNEVDHRRFVHALISGRHTEEEEDFDQETIALFDEILRQEGNGDVFEIRQFHPDSEDEDEDQEEDGSNVE